MRAQSEPVVLPVEATPLEEHWASMGLTSPPCRYGRMPLTALMLFHHTQRAMGEFYWCKECQRAYGKAQWVATYWRCPTGFCRGDLWSAVSWNVLRLQHADLPKEPLTGALYPVKFVSRES